MSGNDVSLSGQSLLVDNFSSAKPIRVEKNKENEKDDISFDDALQKSSEKVDSENSTEKKEEKNEFEEKMNPEENEVKTDLITNIVPLTNGNILPEESKKIIQEEAVLSEKNDDLFANQQSDALKKILVDLPSEKINQMKNYIEEQIPDSKPLLQKIIPNISENNLSEKSIREEASAILENPEIMQKILDLVQSVETKKMTDFKNLTPNTQDNSASEEISSSIFSGLENLVNQAKTEQQKITLPTQKIETSLHDNAWPNHLGEKIMWLVNQPIKTAEIHLNPAHLGPLEIHLKMEHEKASVNFFTNHNIVKDAIDQALPKLKEILNNNGINLSDMNAHTFEHSQYKRPDPEQNDNNKNEIKINSATTDLAATPLVTKVSKLGIIDFYA